MSWLIFGSGTGVFAILCGCIIVNVPVNGIKSSVQYQVTSQECGIGKIPVTWHWI